MRLDPPQRSTIRARPLLVPALLFLSALGCQSGDERDEPVPAGKPEPYVPLPDEAPQSIGYFLTVFDRSLQQWSQLKLGASTARDQSALRVLEGNMEKRARERREELIQVLEGGAPLNRRIAATALGFTHDPTVLGPLLAALSDPDPTLVQRALLGLGVLARPETPLGEIRYRLLNDSDAWTRSNAAFALLALASAGHGSSELAEGCRAALADSDAGVRAQCASALGELADPAAVEPLAELLDDGDNLVSLAASLSIASIGRQRPEQKGAAARALAGSLDAVREERRPHVLGALRWLADHDFGEDAGPWLEWAHKLP